MFAHFIAFLLLAGAGLLVVGGLGIAVFALARGDDRLFRRALLGTGAFAAAYGIGTVLSAAVAPRRVLPLGQEISFCGFDCHLHVSVAGSEMERDRLAVAVRVRSDARQAPEYPRYLQFRLVGADGTILTAENESAAFSRPLGAGESYVDSLQFTAPAAGAPYTLRVIYPDLPETLLLGPANSRSYGKSTLSLGS